MSNLGQLIQTIDTALSSNDNHARSEAEKNILMYFNSNPAECIFNCASILESENVNLNNRQQAGTVAFRLINQKVKNVVMEMENTGRYFWEDFTQEQKTSIKDKVLTVLISPHPVVMRSGASIIASIATIEVPKGEWHDIVDILAETCTNEDLNSRNAAITTLGFMCEQIKNSGHRLNDHLSEQILGGIIVGTRQTESNLIETSLKALENSLFFLESMMSNPLYRDTVFEVFTNNFKNNIHVEFTYRALYEFVRAASPYLGCYRKILIDLTEAHLEKRNDLSILNLEMWEIIGSNYFELEKRMKERVVEMKKEDNFLQSVGEEVLPNIMKCLLILNKKEEDNEEFRSSAAKALESFVKVCDRNIVDLISNSVATIINSEDPYTQQATVILFSTISEYSDRDYALNLFKNGFEHLFGLLNSQNKIVVKNSLVGFVRLAEAFPEVFLLHNNIEGIISCIYNFANVDLHDVRLTSVLILVNISEGLKENPQPVCNDPNILLSKMVHYFTESKLKMATEQPVINEKICEIIMNISMYTTKNTTLSNLMEFMINQYYDIVNKSMQNVNLLIEYVVSIIHTSLLAHKNVPPSNEILVKLCDLINFQIKKFGIEGESLSLIGACATTYSKQFEQRIQIYWPHVSNALLNPHDITTYKGALACVGDFCRVMETDFFNQAVQVLKMLLENINKSLDREIKLSIITCIGDIILCLGEHGASYLEDILKIVDICFEAIYGLANNDKDSDYAEELKANLIELYSCLAFAINTKKKVNMKMFEHFGNVATFIVRTCHPSCNPTVDYLRSCIYLIQDETAFFINFPYCHDKILEIIKSKEIRELVMMLGKHDRSKETMDLIHFLEKPIKN